MPIYRGSALVTPRRAGVDLARVYRGSQLVWQAVPPEPLPVVQITGTAYGVAQAQFRQACIDYGTTYDTVEVLPFRLDTSQVAYMASMFDGCSSLTTVPDLDTSQVTNMASMFRNCAALTHVPDLDTAQATNMASMFYGCSSLTTVPDLDTSQVAYMSSMFRDCTSLTTVPDMDTSQATNVSYMFRDCTSLTTVPDMDTSQATNVSYMFYNCSLLTDGNVRLIGKHPSVTTGYMIYNSGLTREPFFDINGNPI